MKRSMMLLPLALLAAGAVHAGSYAVVQESECPLVSRSELAQAIEKAGRDTGLKLAKDMALRADLRCAVNAQATGANRYHYTFRATIEKQLADGEQLRWAPVAQLTRYGATGAGASLLTEVRFTVRDVIRQEP